MSAVVHIDYGDEVRRLRTHARLSQAQLADAIGSSQQTIDRIERGETRYSRATAPALDLLRAIVAARDEEGTAPPYGDRLRSDVVVQRQDEIEIYEGGFGGVVIHALDSSPGGEDQTIVIRPEHVDAVVAALLRVKAEVTK